MFKTLKNNYLVSLISFIVSIYLLVVQDTAVDGYQQIWLIPFVYSILNTIYHTFQCKKTGLGLIVLNCTMFIKYVLSPALIVLTKSYYGLNYAYGTQPISENLNLSIYLIVYEMILIFFILIIYQKKKLKTKEKQVNYSSNTERKSAFILITFSLLLLLLIINKVPMLISNNFLIISKNVINNALNISGFYTVAFSIIKICFFVGFSILIKSKVNEKNQTYLLLLYILLSLVFIGISTATSRWALLIPFIQLIFIGTIIFPRKKKSLIVIMCIMCFISIASMTLYKRNKMNSNYIDTIKILSQETQSYFSGPRNVALSIEVAEKYDNRISFKTIINSMLTSMPYLSKYASKQDRFAYYYNSYIFGENKWEDQIIPSIGEGLAIFGIIGCNTFTLLYVLIILYFNDKLKYEKDIKYIYLYSHICIWYSFSLGLNLAIIFSSFLTNILTISIIYYIIEKLVNRRTNEKN